MASEEFGAFVKRQRVARQWTQERLSQEADGLDQGAISAIERGKSRPLMETIQKLATAFGMDVGDLARIAGYLPSDIATVPTPKMITVHTRHGARTVTFAEALAYLEGIPDEHLRRDLAEWRATMSPEAFERHVAELYGTMLNSADAFVSGIRVANGVV